MEVLRISTVVDRKPITSTTTLLEVLRISTVVDASKWVSTIDLLEVLRISTVVDSLMRRRLEYTFGSTKNFYCCR